MIKVIVFYLEYEPHYALLRKHLIQVLDKQSDFPLLMPTELQTIMDLKLDD